MLSQLLFCMTCSRYQHGDLLSHRGGVSALLCLPPSLMSPSLVLSQITATERNFHFHGRQHADNSDHPQTTNHCVRLCCNIKQKYVSASTTCQHHFRHRHTGDSSGGGLRARLRGLGTGGECKPVHQHVLIPESHNLGLVTPLLTGSRLEHPLMQQALHQRLAPPPQPLWEELGEAPVLPDWRALRINYVVTGVAKAITLALR